MRGFKKCAGLSPPKLHGSCHHPYRALSPQCPACPRSSGGGGGGGCAAAASDAEGCPLCVSVAPCTWGGCTAVLCSDTAWHRTCVGNMSCSVSAWRHSASLHGALGSPHTGQCRTCVGNIHVMQRDGTQTKPTHAAAACPPSTQWLDGTSLVRSAEKGCSSS